MKEVSELDLAPIAGFIDGEGCGGSKPVPDGIYNTGAFIYAELRAQ